MIKNYVAAFDFDGVIWNSVDECFHEGYTVFREMKGDIPADPGFLREKFREGRYLAKTGDDFYITLHLMNQNPGIDFKKLTYEEYYSYRESLKADMKEFAGKFYGRRKRMQEENLEEWLSLQGPFEGVIEQLPEIQKQFKDLAICSTKDAASINLLLSRYGQEYATYGREASTHKSEQIKMLSKDMNVTPDRIIFIDDLVENLIHVSKMGCIGVLAGWGYNNPNVWKEAKEFGFPLISRENIADQLTNIVNNRESEPSPAGGTFLSR